MNHLSKSIESLMLPRPWLVALFSACLLTAACGKDDHDSHDHSDHRGNHAEVVEQVGDHAEHDGHAGHDHAEAAVHSEAHDKHAEQATHEEEVEHVKTGGSHEAHQDHDNHEHMEEAPHDDHEEHEDHDDHEDDAVTVSDEILREFDIPLGTAASDVLDEEVILPGEIQFNREQLAYVTPRYAGTVTAIKARLADEVKKGQVLATLESNDTLRPFEVKAPFAGTVVAYEITPGETVEAGVPLFTVADLSSVWADLRIYQRDLNKVRQGQRVVVVNGHEGPQFTGTIDYIAPTIDEHTRTGLARVVVDNQAGEWRPGQFVKGSVAIDEHRAEVVIPRSAVLTHEGEKVVFVRTDEGFEPRPIQLGHSDATSHEVVSGLKPGETYVTRNAISLKAEMNKGSFGGHAGHVH
jgi:cobalt-zinc-cadmium efflux system membrane fusion protein